MNKFLKIFLITSIVIITGCSNNNEKNIIEKMNKKLEDAKSYYLEGQMEIYNNEDTYTYDIEVSYKKGDYYKVDLTNKLNNHRQVILRNNEGVYVITPSLNKSYKFQSDWPYNNSQVYLLNSIYEDIKTDEEKTFKKNNDGYIYTSKINYPNNKSLKKQKVYIDKNNKVKKVEVLDKNNNISIKMTFKDIEYDKKFDKNYFDINSILKPNNKIENDNKENTTKEEQNNEKKIEETKEETENNTNNTKENNTTYNTNEDKKEEIQNNNEEEAINMDEILYPMYLPTNTYLTNEEKINTTSGTRLILTFGGDSSFTLVEETSKNNTKEQIIPVSGELGFLNDVIGVVNDNSIMWNSKGIDYYMVSETIETSELIEIANSISALPVSK